MLHSIAPAGSSGSSMRRVRPFDLNVEYHSRSDSLRAAAFHSLLVCGRGLRSGCRCSSGFKERGCERSDGDCLCSGISDLRFGEQAVEVAGVDVRGAEVGVGEDAAEEVDVGRDAADDILVQRAQHAVDGRLARGRVGDELGEHGVVVERNAPALVDGAVFAQAGAAGLDELGDPAGRREEVVVRIFGVDAALDGVAAQLDILLRDGQRLAFGDGELQMDEVEAGDELGDGVLDLQARVHLEEVEVLLPRRGGTRWCRRWCSRRERELDGGLAHAAAQIFADDGGRRFLDHLLVAALHGAFAFAEVEAVAVMVGDELYLDVARLKD